MKKSKSNSGSRFSLSAILRYLEGISFLRFNWLMGSIPYVFFLMFLSIIYIWNNHKGVKMVREYKSAEEDMTEVMWNYNTLKDELTRSSRQTEVAELVSDKNMYELTDPPYTIIKRD